MPHPLHNRLAEIRRRVRQVLLVYGLSWLLAAGLGAVLAVGTVDWLLHLDDSGVRLILGVGILLLTSWVAYRALLAPLLVRIDDRELALRIEARYPAFQDSLASTVQFLEEGVAPRLGSPALQQRVIDRTLAQVERLDFHDVIQTRSMRRAAIGALAVCITTALIIGFNQAEASTALKRLLFPFAAHPWPKQTALRLVTAQWEFLESDPEDPMRIARGDTLELYVINLNSHGRLPAKVHLEFRLKDGEVTSELLPRATLREPGGEAREVCAAQMVVKSPLAFRAVGGDDETPWFLLEVVPPPVVKRLQITLTPPAYVHQPATKLPPGVGHIEALVGTKVRIEAQANKPLGSAALRLKDQEQFPIQLADNGQKLSTDFVIREAGVYSYWLDLKDRQGFENSDAPRYEVRALQDTVPEIAIESPAADMQVTPTASIPLRTIAKDDLGLKQIRLQFKIEPMTDAAAVTVPLFEGEGRPTQKSVEYTWNLADLKLAPGARLLFFTEATDDFDLAEGHVGRSSLRTLTIVSPEEKSQELSDRQTALLADLERTFKLESDARAQVSELQLQQRKAGKLRPQDLDLLQRVELQQRQVASNLQDPAEGVEVRTRALLSEMSNNQIEDPETRGRLEQIADELKRLGTEHLPLVEQELTQARKDAQTEAPGGDAGPAPEKPSPPAKQTPDSERTPEEPAAAETPEKPVTEPPPAQAPPARRSSTIGEALDQAEKNQAAVQESLQDLLRQLAQWRDQRNVTRDLSDIIAGQTNLKEDTAELAKQTVTKTLQALSPQEQADLARLAERQQKEAERMEQLHAKMAEMIDRLDKSDPATAGNLKDALEQARQNATAGRMKETARQIAENNVGQAAQEQQQILEKLQDLDALLRNRSDNDGEMLVKKLKQAEDEIEGLRKQQAELLQTVREAGEMPQPQEREQELARLQKQQRQLQQEVAQLARRLQRLQAQQPGESAQRAAGRMEQAEQQLQQGDQEQAAAQQQEALDDLEQAQRELAAERQAAEEQLVQQRLEKIADDLKSMIGRQQNVLDETRRLAEIHASKGNWTRAQLKSLRDLADVQRGLQHETSQLVEHLSAAEVFALALKGAARQMDLAAKLLSDKETGPATQRAEQAALQRFVDLVAALKLDTDEPQQAQQNPEQQKPPENKTGPAQDGIPMLSELKMLLTMQRELNARTQELAQKRDQEGELTPADAQELQALAQEQGALADLTRNITRLTPGDPEPGPEPETTDPPSQEKTE